jgi:hypothetical protein
MQLSWKNTKGGYPDMESRPVRKKLDAYLPILNILVPQVGHTPWVAGLPFFIVICFASFISLLALHFTQYASAILYHLQLLLDIT